MFRCSGLPRPSSPMYERHDPLTPFHSLGFMTVRRRFLLTPSFARLIRRERGGLRHVEGFFPEQRDRSAWVRLEEDRSLLILTTAGPNGEVEDQTEVPVAHAQALLDACAGAVDYTRTILPIGDKHALVDEIIRPRVLHLATVEFASVEEARGLRPLEWFGPEVTGDPRYTNQSIALRGLDEAPEIPLSDAALDSLIDALDGRFPAQARMASTGPKAQASGESARGDPDEIEETMMRNMGRTRQKGTPA
jgi:CYTH domain-containing protein